MTTAQQLRNAGAYVPPHVQNHEAVTPHQLAGGRQHSTMKTQYEIRNPKTNGIFIGFDSERDAMFYWHENIEKAPVSDYRHGALVVRHSWEAEAEAETARLDWLAKQHAHIGKETDDEVAHYEVTICMPIGCPACPDDIRKAIDIARNAPQPVTEVIWPAK